MPPLTRTAAVLIALATVGAARGGEPIERIAPVEVGTRTATLGSGPRAGGSLDAAGIWPAEAGSLWPLHPQPTDFPLDPPPLIGPMGAIPRYPEGFTDPKLIDPSDEPPPRHVWPYKDGFFQRFTVVGGWLPDAGSNDLEMTELKASLTVALPFPTSDFPLLITPNFDTRLLGGPLTPDLPPRLYSATVGFMWVPKISDRLLGILAFEPGIYSDFDQYDANAWRYLGRAILLYHLVPDRWQIGGGVLYLDRDDFNILPVGGAIWTPTDEVRLEFVFPQPRAAYRLAWDGRREDWVYLAGEVGGDSYSLARASGVRENVALFDFRLNLGIERQYNGGAGARLEIGYVFNRQIDYFTSADDVQLNPTLLLRAGFSL